MNATVRWILIIVGLLVSNALAVGYLILASSTSRADVIPDYYAKATRYDNEIDQAAKNRALGWTVTAEPGLSIEVRDAAGQRVTGARVTVATTSRATGQRAALELVEHDGRYIAAHRVRGLEDLAITVERGGERFTARALVE